MDLELPSLDSLGRQFGTDKASGGHDYLSSYEALLGDLRHDEIKVLEIGVQFGSSLRMWEAYFPNATIVGADIHPGVKVFTGGRVHTEVVDQGNLQDLVRLGTTHGPFDLVVEDGSHTWGHQIDTFKTLFPYIKPVGFYIVEDLHTNFGTLDASYRGNSRVSCVDYLKTLVNLQVADDQIDIRDEEDMFLRSYARNVESITFLRRACVIKKRYRPAAREAYVPGSAAPEAAERPLLENTDPLALPVTISCHIGAVGDWHSKTGSIRTLRDGEDIQGFILYAKSAADTELEYRARLANGSWTAWAACGDFVGTMGVSEALTGFSVRLTGAARADFSLEYAGLFRTEPEPVLVGNEADCIAPSSGELYGMQIVLRRR